MFTGQIGEPLVEFSLKEKGGNKSKASWLKNYVNATLVNIHKENYREFIT
jgi:hypothetical protein